MLGMAGAVFGEEGVPAAAPRAGRAGLILSVAAEVGGSAPLFIRQVPTGLYLRYMFGKEKRNSR